MTDHADNRLPHIFIKDSTCQVSKISKESLEPIGRKREEGAP